MSGTGGWVRYRPVSLRDGCETLPWPAPRRASQPLRALLLPRTPSSCPPLAVAMAAVSRFASDRVSGLALTRRTRPRSSCSEEKGDHQPIQPSYHAGMHRLIRDIVVAVVGGVIVGLIVTFTTSLTHLQLALVYAAALVACGLLLAGLELPRLIRQRREIFKAEVIAAARDAVINELASQAVPRQSTSPGGILRAVQTRIHSDEREKLIGLLEEGRMVQARLREGGYGNTELQGELAVDVGKWEGMGLAALVNRPDYLREFRNAPGDPRLLSTSEAYRRVEHQLGVLEEVIQDLGVTKKGDQTMAN